MPIRAGLIVCFGFRISSKKGLSASIGVTDAAAQLHLVIDKFDGAFQSLGCRLEDAVRTRVYVQNLSDWEAAARAHGALFREIQPANTLIQAELVGDEYLVEMEAKAVLGQGR
jgi:enamine deaminase RidA (YjgF/YER057c/UK114 family)